MPMDTRFDLAKSDRNVQEWGLPFTMVLDFEWDSAVIEEHVRVDDGERRRRAFGYTGGRLFALVFAPRAEKYMASACARRIRER
ncbi:BrnT family toxin [Pandoraea terrigena]|uniref:BrnT family toxin n=1 Tax=Pandoraea terrigena TaxID=2508292 RepID=A0A5E4UPG2_9BURK|nr:BrnT family toxin [Pandoraea terrigena]VVE01872.1 hypothetical protein PTE31013_02186 [Pandoraea terrigena]